MSPAPISSTFPISQTDASSTPKTREGDGDGGDVSHATGR